MSIHTDCEGCGSRLKVADRLAGSTVKCPKCGKLTRVIDTAVAPLPTVRRRQQPRQQHQPEDLDQLEPVEDDDGQPLEAELPRKRKRKARRRKRASFSMPAWAWWISGVALLLIITAVAIILAAVAGMRREVMTFAIQFFIMLPISTVILIVSMLVSSHLAGGMDFGDVRIAIPKAITLLFIVNAVTLLPSPYGLLVGFPIWLFGLMFMFNLDLWETRFLILINWGMNNVAAFFLIAALANISQAGHADRDNNAPPPVIQPQPASE